MNLSSFFRVPVKANKKIVSLIAFLLVCAACGRKQRTLFQFPVQEPVRISKLALPAVRGLRVNNSATGAVIDWEPVDTHKLPVVEGQKPELIGYHVYRLTKGRFLPKQPITKNPIVTTSYVDRRAKRQALPSCYAVRALFIFNNQTTQGPLSNIVHFAYPKK